MILHEICEMKGWELERVMNKAHDDLIQRYLDNIVKDGTWCGSETIVAVVNLYRVEIVIYTDDSNPWHFAIPDSTSRINLFFSGESQKNHYDVVVNAELNPNESVTAISTPSEGPPIIRKYTDEHRKLHDLFVAIVKAWLGSHLSEWQVDTNALNLRRASINELSLNSSYYIQYSPSFRGMSQEHFMEILTHWSEENICVDIDVGAAAAEVLQTKVVINISDGETITFMPRTGPPLRTIRIQEIQRGLFVPVDPNARPCDSHPISTDAENSAEQTNFIGLHISDNGTKR